MIIDTKQVFWYIVQTMKKSKLISDQVREAIKKSGKTRYEISKHTGVEQASLSRFHHKQRSISLEAVDRIGKYLGLEITPKKKGR